MSLLVYGDTVHCLVNDILGVRGGDTVHCLVNVIVGVRGGDTVHCLVSVIVGVRGHYSLSSECHCWCTGTLFTV